MVFLELALYGIRNFTQLARLALKPGFNVVHGGNGSGKSTIRDILVGIVAPVSDTDIDSLKTPKSPDLCQAGIIFNAKDGRVCRLVRDYNGRKSSLAELDTANKFQTKMQDEPAIVKFLTEETGGLSHESLIGLYSIQAGDLPSARVPFPVRTGAPTGQNTSSLASPAATDLKSLPQDRQGKIRRLEELRGYLTQGDKLAAMEDQLSDLQARSAESRRRLRTAREKSEELEKLAQQAASFESLKGLPEDYNLILETSAQQEQLKNDQLVTMSEDEEFLKQELQLIAGPPFFFTKSFIAGGVLFLAPMIVLTVLNLQGLFQQLLTIVMLGGIGLMGYAGFLDFQKLNKRKGTERKLRDLDRKRNKLESAFKKENAPCLDLLKKTGSADIPALKEKIRSYERYRTARRELESERDQFLGKKTIEELQLDTETYAQQISDVESRLKSSSGTLPSDIYLIQEEVRSLERELVDAQGHLPPPVLPAPTAESGAGPSPRPATEFMSPVLRDALNSTPVRTALAPRLAELNSRMAQLMMKTGGVVPGDLTLNETFVPTLTSAPSKSAIPWASLSSGQKDFCHLVIHLAAVDLLSKTHPVPLVLDNPLNVLDPARQQMMLDILREIAQNKQVILLSSAEYPARPGDHLIHLK